MLLFFIFLLSADLFSQTSGKGGLKVYLDKSLHFSLEYPSDFKVAVGARAKSDDSAFMEPGQGKKLVKVVPIRIPGKYHGWYEFNIWRDTDPKAKCGEPDEDELNLSVPISPVTDSPKTREIDGQTFYAYTGSEGGMSKGMSVVGFRSKVSDKCWQIQSVTYQVSAFDDFKSFDEKIINNAFERFIKSFRFN